MYLNHLVIEYANENSNINFFGQWITSYNWSPIVETVDCEAKYNEFNTVMSAMIEHFFPKKQLKTTKSDKAWLTQSLKLSIRRLRELYICMEKHPTSLNFGEKRLKVLVTSFTIRRLKSFRALTQQNGGKKLKLLAVYHPNSPRFISCCRKRIQILRSLLTPIIIF